jgi:hypothetical protein
MEDETDTVRRKFFLEKSREEKEKEKEEKEEEAK